MTIKRKNGVDYKDFPMPPVELDDTDMMEIEMSVKRDEMRPEDPKKVVGGKRRTHLMFGKSESIELVPIEETLEAKPEPKGPEAQSFMSDLKKL